MTALASAAFAIALHCGSGVDPDLLAGFATVESAGNPLAVHQNVRGTPGRSFTPATVAEAVRIASSLISAGASVDTGTFQINSKNLDLLQVSLSDTFDTCRAAAAAARLIAIMSRYNSGSPSASLPYAKRVTASVRAIKDGNLLQVAAEPSPPPQANDPADPQPPAWDMEAVAGWRRRHTPTPEDAALAPPDEPAIAVIINKEPKK